MLCQVDLSTKGNETMKKEIEIKTALKQLKEILYDIKYTEKPGLVRLFSGWSSDMPYARELKELSEKIKFLSDNKKELEDININLTDHSNKLLEGIFRVVVKIHSVVNSIKEAVEPFLDLQKNYDVIMDAINEEYKDLTEMKVKAKTFDKMLENNAIKLNQ
jgi:hypothetical protein